MPAQARGVAYGLDLSTYIGHSSPTVINRAGQLFNLTSRSLLAGETRQTGVGIFVRGIESVEEAVEALRLRE